MLFFIEAQEYTRSLRRCFSINLAFLVFEQETMHFWILSFIRNSLLLNTSLCLSGWRQMPAWPVESGTPGVRSVGALPGSRTSGGSWASLRARFLLKKWRPRSPLCTAGARIPREAHSGPVMRRAQSRCSSRSDRHSHGHARNALYSWENSSLWAAEHHAACMEKRWERKSSPVLYLITPPWDLLGFAFAFPFPPLTAYPRLPCRLKYLNPDKITGEQPEKLTDSPRVSWLPEPTSEAHGWL